MTFLPRSLGRLVFAAFVLASGENLVLLSNAGGCRWCGSEWGAEDMFWGSVAFFLRFADMEEEIHGFLYCVHLMYGHE